MALLVVRHANAGRRSAYTGDDRQRPLSPRGRRRAQDLVSFLSRYRPQRILSSPFVRCCETVQPLAQALSLPVESLDELSEGHGADAVGLMRRMAGESAVLCTHGDVALEMAAALGMAVPGTNTDGPAPGGTASDGGAGSRSRRSGAVPRLQKGEVWVVQSAGTDLVVVEYLRRTGTAAPS